MLVLRLDLLMLRSLDLALVLLLVVLSLPLVLPSLALLLVLALELALRPPINLDLNLSKQALHLGHPKLTFLRSSGTGRRYKDQNLHIVKTNNHY